MKSGFSPSASICYNPNRLLHNILFSNIFYLCLHKKRIRGVYRPSGLYSGKSSFNTSLFSMLTITNSRDKLTISSRSGASLSFCFNSECYLLKTYFKTTHFKNLTEFNLKRIRNPLIHLFKNINFFSKITIK